VQLVNEEDGHRVAQIRAIRLETGHVRRFISPENKQYGSFLRNMFVN
tara:strand:- start:254 stop:394 length:141 start_codon:yes stop_codon:yes gene_type:complete